MSNPNRFSRFVQPQKCRMCGKLTTYGQLHGLDIPLCERCYGAAGIENEHYDTSHKNKMDGCPLCYPEQFPYWK